MNNTLVKGLQLLEVLARSTEAVGVTELATSLALGKSNIHRLLQALVELGYVTRQETRGAYRASLKLWELGRAIEAHLPVKAAAAEAMSRLSSRTRETVHLSVLDGDEVVYLAKIDSPEPVRAYSEVGGRAPAHCVATGKAILAWQPQATLAGLSRRLHQHTPRTIVEPAEFLREMERVRAGGYAVNRGEWRESVWGIAAPVFDAQGLPIAAIGVSGPSTRVKPAQIKSLAEEVLAAAKQIGSQLL